MSVADWDTFFTRIRVANSNWDLHRIIINDKILIGKNNIKTKEYDAGLALHLSITVKS
jgi:hypothetical protein